MPQTRRSFLAAITAAAAALVTRPLAALAPPPKRPPPPEWAMGIDYGFERSTCVLVEITGHAAGGGKYHGRIVAYVDPEVVLHPLDEDNLQRWELRGTVLPPEKALILNTREVNRPTHDLDPGGCPDVFPGVTIGRTRDGHRIVAINGVQFIDCQAFGE